MPLGGILAGIAALAAEGYVHGIADPDIVAGKLVVAGYMNFVICLAVPNYLDSVPAESIAAAGAGSMMRIQT